MRNVFKQRECSGICSAGYYGETGSVRVIDQVIQKDYKNLQGPVSSNGLRSQRIPTGKQFDVEIQQDNEGASPKEPGTIVD